MVDEGGLAVAWHESGTVKSILGCGERPCEFRDKLAFYSTSFPILLNCCATMIPQMQLLHNRKASQYSSIRSKKVSSIKAVCYYLTPS
jgi:hypothetical protein